MSERPELNMDEEERPPLTAQVPEEMKKIYKKAAENLGYPFDSIAEGEEITKLLKVSKGCVYVNIGTSTNWEIDEVKEEVLRLEEEAFKDNS